MAEGDQSTRIIGGSQASISESPWQVALIRSSAANNSVGQECGGSIYNASWIITAAHCLAGRTAAGIRVLAGTNYLSPVTLSGIPASSIIIHPNYNQVTKANDIGLIRLSTPLTLQSGTIQSINLPSSPPTAGASALITGWGNMSRYSDFFPAYLQKAQVQVHTDSYCASVYPNYVSSLMMCGYTPDYSKDTCQGDSGGPLAVNVSGRWELHGVTSHGRGCAQSPYPGVYAETFNYVNWIKGIADISFTTSPAPTISGSMQSGQTLTANVGTWNPVPDTFSYQWLANNQLISGATSTTLRLSPELVGSRISLSVTGSKAGIATTTRTSSQTAAVLGLTQTASGTQTISGTATVGQTLTANLSIWHPDTTHTFVWYRGSAVISGANQSTYTLTPTDLNQTIRVAVTGFRVGYNPLTLSSAATTAVTGAFLLAPDPQITGTAAVGSTLTASTGIWSPTPRFTYQWLRNGVNISRATAATYTLSAIDRGSRISVRVVATSRGLPTLTKLSPQTDTIVGSFTTSPAPTISGSMQSGQTLTANVGTWNPVPDTFSYQWLANNQLISGATSTTLRLSPELVGSRISLSVTGSKAGIATTTRTSSQTAAVLGLTQTASGTQTISGTATVGQTLTANLSIWHPDTTHTFVWYRGSAVISGANQSTYTLTPTDLNQTIRVAVTGFRVGYNPLTLSSAATTAVTGAFLLAPDPQITGTAAVGSTLTASTGIWSPTPRFTYQWLRDGTNISGATSRTYVLTSADFGRSISFTLTATLIGYPTGSKTSASVGPVQEGAFTSSSNPVVSGPLVNGGLLTATLSAWAPTPTTVQYQWLRSGEIIEGANQVTYRITSSDLGAGISVQVTASAIGVSSVVRASATRQDWTYSETTLGTYAARSLYSTCLARGSSSTYYNDWQNVGGTYFPCDPYLASGVRLYDPSSDMMIVHSGLSGVPSSAIQYRLTFTYQTIQSHFGFIATDSSVDNLDSGSRFLFPYALTARTVSSNWISIKEPGELDFLIFDSTSGSPYGFLSISTIKVELRSIR